MWKSPLTQPPPDGEYVVLGNVGLPYLATYSEGWWVCNGRTVMPVWYTEPPDAETPPPVERSTPMLARRYQTLEGAPNPGMIKADLQARGLSDDQCIFVLQILGDAFKSGQATMCLEIQNLVADKAEKAFWQDDKGAADPLREVAITLKDKYNSFEKS